MTRLALALLLTLTGAPGAALGESPGAPRIIAVKFHADWCGSCKQMGPIFEDLRNKFDGREVLFVVLDRTNVTTRHQSTLLASALGIGPVYESHPGTGFILLVDGSTREVRHRLGASLTLKQMSAQLDGALAGSQS